MTQVLSRTDQRVVAVTHRDKRRRQLSAAPPSRGQISRRWQDRRERWAACASGEASAAGAFRRAQGPGSSRRISGQQSAEGPGGTRGDVWSISSSFAISAYWHEAAAGWAGARRSIGLHRETVGLPRHKSCHGERPRCHRHDRGESSHAGRINAVACNSVAGDRLSATRQRWLPGSGDCDEPSASL